MASEDTAFPAIIGAQDQDEIFDGDDQDQRPQDQRDNAEDVCRRGRDGARPVKALPHCIERARADIAKDNAEAGERQDKQALFTVCSASSRPLRRRSTLRIRRRVLHCDWTARLLQIHHPSRRAYEVAMSPGN